MKEYIQSIIIAILGSGAFFGTIFTFIQFMIGRHDREFEKKIEDKIREITEELRYVSLGSTRTQLMVLMTHYKNRHDEVMKLAHRYFVDKKGNFYLGELFKEYCEEEKIELPSWYNDQV